MRFRYSNNTYYAVKYHRFSGDLKTKVSMFFDGGGMNVQHSLSLHLNTTTEVLLSKTPNPQLLPGRLSINDFGCVFMVCVFTAVYVHLGWVNAEHYFSVWVTRLVHFTFQNLSRMNHEDSEEQTGFCPFLRLHF